MSTPVDRIVPFNVEAEEAVLGSLLLDSQAIIRIASFLKPDDFYREKNRWVYEAAIALYERREAIDFLTVRDELERNQRLEEAGGPGFLTSLLNAVPTSIHIEHYAHIVERAATRRRLINAASDIAKLAYDETDEIENTLDKAEQIIFGVSQRSITRDLMPISQVLNDYFDKIEYLQAHHGQVSGITTGFIDLNKLLGGFQRSDLVIVAARPGMGKCVAHDTLVMDANTGEVVTIADLYRRGRNGEQFTLFSINEAGKLTRTKPAAFVDDGIKPVFCVKTRLGREIKTTLTHPFLTFDGWRPLGELAPGNRIGMPRELPVFGAERLPHAEVVLLGYLIGDGGLTRTTPRMTTISDRIAAEIHECAAAYGLTVRIDLRPDRTPNYSIVGQKNHKNPVTEMLKRHGLMGKLAKDKTIPQAVYRLPKDQLALFLNRLFSTDGSAYIASPKGTTKTFARISYSSVSKSLIYGVQHLLLRFGINAKLRAKKVKYRGEYRPAYELEMLHSADILRFVNEIGAYGKEEAMQAVARHAEARKGNINRDNLPSSVWERILDVKGKEAWADVSERTGRPRNHNWHVGKRGPSRTLLGELATGLASDELLALARSDIYWDEIVSIEAVGQEQVYDLTMPVTHNFVAADFFVHNTSLMLGFGLSAAMADQAVAVFSLEMSAEQLVQRLISAETGIDQHRLRLGLIRDEEMPLVTRAMGVLEGTKIFIDDTPGITALEMRTKARRLHAEYPLGLIVVDYLQLMHGGGRMENRVQEISHISRSLKELARELNVPVIAASQLSRAVESRHDRRPMLSDLRESGSIEQDADVVVFIYRDEYYNEGSEKKNIAEIIVAKHRNGPTGAVELFFIKEQAKFADLATVTDEYAPSY